MASSNEIKYDKEKLLGLGGNAAVFEGTFGEQQVAVKRVQIIRKNDRERTLHKLDHLNVVKLYGSSKEEDFVLYALELCAANLHDYCTGKYSGPMLTETEAMIQMADGLNYIHSKNFVHRDLKPENILISYGNPVHMKISDFGFSKPISNSGSYPLSGTFIGTEGWLAPELLQLYDINNTECANDLYKRATYTSDIFALGCVFFYFLVRSHPFGEKMTEISNNISKNYPVRWLDIVRLDNTGLEFFLIRQMIRVKPEQRISLNKVALVLRIDYAGNMLQNGRSSSYDGSDARSMRNGTEWNNYKINQTYQPQQENRVHLQQHGNRHTAEQSASRPSRDVVKQKPVVDPPTQGIKKKSSVQEVVSKVSKLLKPKKRHSKRNSTSDLHSSLPAIEEDRGSSVSVSTQSLSSENSQFREDLQLAGNEFVDEVNVGKSPYLAKGSQSPDDELPNIMATVSTQQQSSPSAAITINSLPFQERLQSNGDDVSDKYKSHNGVHFAREINKTWSLRLPTKPNTSFNNRRNSVGASGMVSNRLKFFESISQSSASGLNILSNKKSISGSATSTVKKNT